MRGISRLRSLSKRFSSTRSGPGLCSRNRWHLGMSALNSISYSMVIVANLIANQTSAEKSTKRTKSFRLPLMSLTRIWHTVNREKTNLCSSSTFLSRWAILSQRCLNERLKMCRPVVSPRISMMNIKLCMPNYGKSARKPRKRPNWYNRMALESTVMRFSSSLCQRVTDFYHATLTINSSR